MVEHFFHRHRRRSLSVDCSDIIARQDARLCTGCIFDRRSDFDVCGFVDRRFERLTDGKADTAEITGSRIGERAHRISIEVLRIGIFQCIEHTFERSFVEHFRIDFIDIILLYEIEYRRDFFHVLKIRNGFTADRRFGKTLRSRCGNDECTYNGGGKTDCFIVYFNDSHKRHCMTPG